MPHVLNDHASAPSFRAFTLIDLMVVVVAIVGVLFARIAGGTTTMRQRARVAQARLLVPMVDQAVQTYRAEDSLRRFPVPPASGWIGFASAKLADTAPLIGDRLETVGLSEIDGRDLPPGGAVRVLMDPWGAPLEYRLDEAMNGVADCPLDVAGDQVRLPEDVSNWNRPPTSGRGARPAPTIVCAATPSIGSSSARSRPPHGRAPTALVRADHNDSPPLSLSPTKHTELQAGI